MKSLKYVGLTLAASLVCVLIGLGILPAGASQPRVQFQTEPPQHQIIPNQTPVQFTLQAIDASGQPLSHARLQLQLLTPARTPWFTSDFPIVEATTLLELHTQASEGKLQFQQILPIRGHYTLKTRVTPEIAGAFAPFEQSLGFSVPENPVKYRNAAILVAILLGFGFGSGWIIAGDQTLESGEVAPQRVRLLLSSVIVIAIAVLLYVNISAEVASAHGSEAHAIGSASAGVQRSQNLELHLSGDQQATVGQLAEQRVQVWHRKTHTPAAGIPIKAQAIALADQKVIFAYRAMSDAAGQLVWKQQFFDGTPHQVLVQATSTETEALQATQPINVAAIAPPLSVRLITLGYWMACFTLSLGMGFYLHRRTLTPG